MKTIKLKNDEIAKKLEMLGGEIIIDGIINIEKYLKTKYRILWILKEPNAPGADWTYQDYLTKCDIESKFEMANDTLKYKMFKKIIFNTYGLLNDNISYEDIKDNIYNESIYGVTECIAYINLKKTIGGSSSYYRTIKESYIENKELLLQQITGYNPNIIIFGGTLGFFEMDALNSIGLVITDENKFHSINNSSRTSFFDVSDKLLLINADHPAYWINSYKKYYEEMVDGLKLWNDSHNRN
jgi:hypothetical protein